MLYFGELNFIFAQSELQIWTILKCGAFEFLSKGVAMAPLQNAITPHEFSF